MQPEHRTDTGPTVSEVAELMDLFRQMADHQQEYFLDQARLLQAGQPNAIQGTAPLPAWWGKEQGGRGNAA